ncbi:MAG: hypothetical protein ACHQK8_02855 [Bacteroidia bacterium]
MNNTYIHRILIFAFVFVLCASNPPYGWVASGSKVKSYDMSIAKGAGVNGGDCATIKSIEEKIVGFGTLRQTISAAKYAGKKIKLTGQLKAENITNKKWAGLYIAFKDKVLTGTFKDIQKSPETGKWNAGWQVCEIEVVIPASAKHISYGAQLTGTGQLWFDEMKIEIISSVGVVENNKDTLRTNKKPVNLNFED